MATNFPGSQDSFTNPTSSDSLDSPDHAAQHANVNDAVEAIELALLDGAPLFIDDTNERVGIGTTSPASPLHLATNGTVSGATPSTTFPLAIDANESNTGLAILTDNTYNGYIRFGDTDDIGVGGFHYDHSTDNLYFRTNASNSMSLDSSGNLDLDGTMHFGLHTLSGSSQWRCVLTPDNYTSNGVSFGEYYAKTAVTSNTTSQSLYLVGGGSVEIGVHTNNRIGYFNTSGLYLEDGWFRTYNATGWYNQSYGGGWYMTDTTYIRNYNSKSVYLSNEIFVPNMDGTSSYNTVRFNSSTGQLMRYTSIAEIKEDITSIKPMMDYLNERSYLYDLRPVLYHEKDKADGTNNTRREYVSGFVAEEVLDVAPELAYYDYNGELVSYANDGLIPHIVAELQRLMPMVEELYGDANPDWVAPAPRPDDRKTAERELYDAASAAQALIGDPNADPLDGQRHLEDEQ